VVIIGQGNVALDCARLLAKPLPALQSTDLTAAALAQLASSTVTDIHVVGRRGHVQAAFTIKELRELTRIPGAAVRVLGGELEAGSTASSEEEVRSSRPLKRITDLIAATAAASSTASTSTSSEQEGEEEQEGGEEEEQKTVHLRFLLSPLRLEGGADGAVRAVVFQKCRLEGGVHQQRAVRTGE
jgi:adrenodoxin-NADP+ reductase